MIRAKFTSIFTYILLSSLLLPCGTVHAQKKIEAAKDTTALFQGVLVGVDLFGAVQRQVSDYGQYEAFLRLNLKGKYFPVFELGMGDAEHEEDAEGEQSRPQTSRTKDWSITTSGADHNRLTESMTCSYTLSGSKSQLFSISTMYFSILSKVRVSVASRPVESV